MWRDCAESSSVGRASSFDANAVAEVRNGVGLRLRPGQRCLPLAFCEITAADSAATSTAASIYKVLRGSLTH